MEPTIKGPDYVHIATFLFGPQQSTWVMQFDNFLIKPTEKQLGYMNISIFIFNPLKIHQADLIWRYQVYQLG